MAQGNISRGGGCLVTPALHLPYPVAGASWAHRAPVGLPGRTEGTAHKHEHPGGTLPASSGHSSDSLGRQLHLGRKQNERQGPQPGLPSPMVLAQPGSSHCSGTRTFLRLPGLKTRKQTVPRLMGTMGPHPLPRVHHPCVSQLSTHSQARC